MKCRKSLLLILFANAVFLVLMYDTTVPCRRCGERVMYAPVIARLFERFDDRYSHMVCTALGRKASVAK